MKYLQYFFVFMRNAVKCTADTHTHIHTSAVCMQCMHALVYAKKKKRNILLYILNRDNDENFILNN